MNLHVMMDAQHLETEFDIRLERKRESGRHFLRLNRARKRAEGRIIVQTDIPTDLIEALDRLKEARGLRGRTPIIEEALRLYLKKHKGP